METDSVTNKVQDMYKKYPYPSPITEINQTNELLNLLRIFELESKTKFDGKKEAEESLTKNITSNSIYEPCEKH